MSRPTRLCPVCTRFGPLDDTVCASCGYDFATGEAPEGGSQSPTQVLADQPIVAAPSGARRALIAVLLSAAAAGGALAVIAAIENYEASESYEVPDISIPSIDFTPIEIGIDPVLSPRACRKVMMEALVDLLADDGAGIGDPGDVLLKAGTELGPLSKLFRRFTDIYITTAGTAAFEGTDAALDQARRKVRKACASR